MLKFSESVVPTQIALNFLVGAKISELFFQPSAALFNAFCKEEGHRKASLPSQDNSMFGQTSPPIYL
jgi:hypothetical protein